MREMKDSGIEWIGEIPANWNIARIKNCFQLKAGNAFPIELQGKDDGEYPVFKAGDISLNNGKISSKAKNFISLNQS